MNQRLAFIFSFAAAYLGAMTASALPTLPSLPRGVTKVVALSGLAAPGGGRFHFIYEPVINNLGQIAYVAALRDSGAGSPNGVFRYHANNTIVIGGPSKFAGGEQLFNSGFPAINGVGAVTFHATTSPGTRMIVKGSGGDLTEVARTGQIPPGSSIPFASLFDSPRINDSGQVAFGVSFNPTSGVTGGVYRGAGGALTEIARLGGVSPSGGLYSMFHWAFPINNAGQVAFAASTTGASSGGVFRGTGATTVKIAQQGDLAPDGDGAFINIGFRTPALNDSGQVAFIGNVDRFAGGRYGGVFRGSGGTVTQIARENQTTPSGDLVFSAFSYGPVINNRGEAAFAAFLRDPAAPLAPNRISIYRGDGVTLTEGMRQGDLAPDGNGRFRDFGNPEMNDRGDVAVMAELSDTLGALLDDKGLYYFSNATGLVQVAREGQPLLGSVITALHFTGDLNHVESTGDDATGLNDLGQVAFSFQLADGRNGAAVWQVPEPSVAALTLTALALLRPRFRRRSHV